MTVASAAKAARTAGVSPARASGRLLRSSKAMPSSQDAEGSGTGDSSKKKLPPRPKKKNTVDSSSKDAGDESDSSITEVVDVPYKGRATGSRITPKRSSASKGTARKTAKAHVLEDDDPEVVEVPAPAPATPPKTKKGGTKAAGNPSPSKRVTRSSKKVVSAPIVVDDEDDLPLSAPTIKSSKKRPIADSESEDEDETSKAKVERSQKASGVDSAGGSRGRRLAKTRRIASPEPEISESDEAMELQDEDEGLDPNEYDRSDPFIDDSALEVDGYDTDSAMEDCVDDDLVADDVSICDNLVQDPLELVEKERAKRRERQAIQTGLDEATARDLASEDEEYAVNQVVQDQISQQHQQAVNRPSMPSTPKGASSATGRFSRASPGPSTPSKSPFTPKSKGRSFKDVVPVSTNGSGNDSPNRTAVKTLDDLYTYRVNSLPAICAVTDVSLQDPQLREYYVDLPNLSRGVLESWNDFSGPGMIMFSRWVDICSQLSFDSCLSAIEFRSAGCNINPSRVSPLDVCVKEIMGSRPKYHLYADDTTPAICVSAVFCNESHLLAPPNKGLKQKWLSGIFHSQEWERFVGFMATVFGHTRMNAQLSKDAIQFTTKAYFGKGKDNQQGDARMSRLFSNVKSPSIKGKGAAEPLVSADNFTLDFDADIPAYNATEVEIDLTTDIDRVDLLPRWEGEVPYGSFVVVAYTVAVFKAEKTRAWTISLNIRWVVVMGVPDSDKAGSSKPVSDYYFERTITCFDQSILAMGSKETRGIKRSCSPWAERGGSAENDTAMNSANALVTDTDNVTSAAAADTIPEKLKGGGTISTQRSFPKELLLRYDSLRFDGPKIESASLFDFVAYVDIASFDALCKDNTLLFAVRIPLSVLAPCLLVQELVELAQLHNILINTRSTKAEMLTSFEGHECPVCDLRWSVFSPHGVSPDPVFTPYRESDFDRIKKSVRPFTALEMTPMLEGVDSELSLRYKEGGIVYRIVEGEVEVARNELELATTRVPWLKIAEKGSKSVAALVARMHGVSFAPRLSRQAIISALRVHQCSLCPPFTVVFRPLEIGKPTGKSRVKTPFEYVPVDADSPVARPAFPPTPPSLSQIGEMATDVCNALKADKFEEAGCMTCGQLVLRRDLNCWADRDTEVSLHCLAENGVARKERKSVLDPVQFEQGPIIENSLSDVCTPCLSLLKKGKRPPHALANGLWIGAVPAQLQDLTFVEQLMIARVRHNRCVVRVSCGQTKMIANVVSFANPTPQVYNKLPPSRKELDEVLAFIFTGVKPPSEEDLHRTPMLVRRNKVYDALHWLRLNHSDYRDLDIDQQTLLTYEERGVPVKVMFKPSDSASNIVASATSVHETEEEVGVDSGDCPFQVHGLTGEQLLRMNIDSRKLQAVNHLKRGGNVLAIGHSENPESIYDNPQLYPQMFPWLFPYGLGGMGAQRSGVISEERHKRWLLMYHDKRFQMDSHFVIVAFNHGQLKSSSKGSFIMTRRSNFTQICRELKEINPTVLASMAKRLEKGPRFPASNEAEKRCFALLDKIDIASSRVPGSISGRKFMRKELWSLVYFKGAPTWFLTIAPVDIKHPLCIYFADTKMKFSPSILGQSERFRLIAKNPVAGARFFHFMVNLLIKIVLRWDNDESKPGIYGDTSAYYGTVEQQGRMTLHLHMLIWILGAPNPREMRDRLLAGETHFKEELLAYLESGQFGDFYTGTHSELQALRDSKRAFQEDEDLRMPVPPPIRERCSTDERSENCPCDSCESLRQWYRDSYQTRVDDILLKSNTHTCYLKKKVTSADGVAKEHVTGKGCINKDGVCTARFPRELYPESTIDSDGHINIKKNEPMINTVSPFITWTFGCNTDSNSLNSGTAVSATVGYVAEYLTKMGLKTYQIFSSAYDVFEKNVDLVDDLHSRDTSAYAGRKLIMKMVNSLTAKMEIGGPMAAMYLLGNPDRYSSHQFVRFYWKTFVDHILSDWEQIESRDPDTGDVFHTNPITASYDEDAAIEDDLPEQEDSYTSRVVVGISGSNYVPRSYVDDYRFRPVELEKACLFDWIQCAVIERQSPTDKTDKFLRFTPDHPSSDKVGVRFDISRREWQVPNFIGPMLPRRDSDESDYYGCVMLTLFAPWRSSIDLRSSTDTWKLAFEKYQFPERFKLIMKNMHVRYECYDGRDDYHNQLKARISKTKDHVSAEEVEEYEDLEFFDELAESDVNLTSLIDEDMDSDVGVWTQRKLGQMRDLSLLLRSAGWQVNDVSPNQTQVSSHSFRPDQNLPASKWKDVVADERKKLLRSRRLLGDPGNSLQDEMDIDSSGNIDAVRILPPQYFLHDFTPKCVELKCLITELVNRFNLNEEQERAFRIVSNHSTCTRSDVEPLRMYIGGMGGTGKTQVIKALLAWFSDRNESHKMIVLAPTGAAASLVNGSTYHSYLSIGTGERRNSGEGSSASLEEARGRMMGVMYIFLDEISMVSCHDLYLIDARLKALSGIDDAPFGGYSMIVAGDFAQLPPAKGLSLYSGEVSRVQSPRESLTSQENTLGLLAWHQFVTVVILKKNMRQSSNSIEDTKFRTMLQNLRFRSCTDEDVAFLKSRIPAYNPELTLNDPRWRNTSVITAWNTYKDQINEMNAARFAAENNKPLFYFYSIDKSTKPGRTANRSSNREKVVPLTASVQKVLWKSAPYTSEHVAGCLPLCIGMPVMIRNNDATELCITKGQEAKVIGWTSYEHPGYPGHSVLDTLFIELINPPKKIKLPHLPVNVVPMTKNSHTVRAVLPNDKIISLNRLQVPVLLNFSMTDYASQGKTREVNVVDLSKCRNHQAIYTALSRGTSASNTMIIQDFNWAKIRGGLSGYLRQEFRELDQLDELTKARYNGTLPDAVFANFRDSTLRNYQRWSEGTFQASTSTPKKRRVSENADENQSPTKKPRLDIRTTKFKRMGLRWDAEHYSCAYDSLFTILKAIWDEKPRRWSTIYKQYSDPLKKLSTLLPRVDKQVIPFEKARDLVRRQLYRSDGRSFPTGKALTDILHLARTLLGADKATPLPLMRCSSCGQAIEPQPYHKLGRFMTMHAPSRSSAEYVQDILLATQSCVCGREARVEIDLAPLFIIHLSNQARISVKITISGEPYRLAGIVYSGENHFSSRVLTSEGLIFRNDGMIEGERFVIEGVLTTDSPVSLREKGTRTAALAVYCAITP